MITLDFPYNTHLLFTLFNKFGMGCAQIEKTSQINKKMPPIDPEEVHSVVKSLN